MAIGLPRWALAWATVARRPSSSWRAGETSGRLWTRAMRTEPIPSQSRSVARTLGEAASTRAEGERRTSTATSAGTSRPGSRARRAATRALPGLEGDPRLHGGGEVGRRRPGDVVAQGEQLELELGHGAPTSSTPSCARRRSSAREVRDLTVPRRQPSAAAVSSSESSSR